MRQCFGIGTSETQVDELQKAKSEDGILDHASAFLTAAVTPRFPGNADFEQVSKVQFAGLGPFRTGQSGI